MSKKAEEAMTAPTPPTEQEIERVKELLARADGKESEWPEHHLIARAYAHLAAQLADARQALEFIAGHGDKTLLGPECDTMRFHEVGANKAFNQMASAAKEALAAAEGEGG